MQLLRTRQPVPNRAEFSLAYWKDSRLNNIKNIDCYQEKTKNNKKKILVSDMEAPSSFVETSSQF